MHFIYLFMLPLALALKHEVPEDSDLVCHVPLLLRFEELWALVQRKVCWTLSLEGMRTCGSAGGQGPEGGNGATSQTTEQPQQNGEIVMACIGRLDVPPGFMDAHAQQMSQAECGLGNLWRFLTLKTW